MSKTRNPYEFAPMRGARGEQLQGIVEAARWVIAAVNVHIPDRTWWDLYFMREEISLGNGDEFVIARKYVNQNRFTAVDDLGTSHLVEAAGTGDYFIGPGVERRDYLLGLLRTAESSTHTVDGLRLADQPDRYPAAVRVRTVESGSGIVAVSATLMRQFDDAGSDVEQGLEIDLEGRRYRHTLEVNEHYPGGSDGPGRGITIPVRDPEAAARALQRGFSPEVPLDAPIPLAAWGGPDGLIRGALRPEQWQLPVPPL